MARARLGQSRLIVWVALIMIISSISSLIHYLGATILLPRARQSLPNSVQASAFTASYSRTRDERVSPVIMVGAALLVMV